MDYNNLFSGYEIAAIDQSLNDLCKTYTGFGFVQFGYLYLTLDELPNHKNIIKNCGKYSAITQDDAKIIFNWLRQFKPCFVLSYAGIVVFMPDRDNKPFIDWSVLT